MALENQLGNSNRIFHFFSKNTGFLNIIHSLLYIF